MTLQLYPRHEEASSVHMACTDDKYHFVSTYSTETHVSDAQLCQHLLCSTYLTPLLEHYVDKESLNIDNVLLASNVSDNGLLPTGTVPLPKPILP